MPGESPALLEARALFVRPVGDSGFPGISSASATRLFLYVESALTRLSDATDALKLFFGLFY